MEPLSGKVALVTGASKGIGRATALRLAREGVALVAGATGLERLETLRLEVENLGAEILVQACDVTRPAGLRRAGQVCRETVWGSRYSDQQCRHRVLGTCG